MASLEYLDLCEKAQSNGEAKYQVYVFDIIESQKMDVITRKKANIKMIKLMIKIYFAIKRENSNILINDLDNSSKFGIQHEPFHYADTFGFTVYRNTISKEEIMALYQQYKKELNIDFDFHINNLYYETNDYTLGNELFFRGYAIDIAANLHKKEYSKLKKKVKSFS